MDLLTDPNAWMGLITLTALELVLGIDNIIFITILASRAEAGKHRRARQLGLLGAFVTRLLLLASIVWLARLTVPLFTVLGREISGRSLVLLGGGLFLIGKATWEISHNLDEAGSPTPIVRPPQPMRTVVLEIMLIDIVFSLDSVITAIGMVDSIVVMIIAIAIALAVMLFASGTIGDYVERHPSLKMLALAFLVLIGTNLVAEGVGQHISKGYTYFAMAFSVAVEMLNLRMRRRARPAPMAEG